MNPMNPMNSMNEDTVRTLLADVAGAPEPPSRISIEAARKTGRRRQWAARVIASGGVAVLVAGGALIVPHLRLAAAPASATGSAAGARIAASVKPAAPFKPAAPAPAPAPAQFNPLELSANFGWLPSFWNEDGASVEETPTFTVVNLVDSQTLKVSPRGWYPDPTLYASARGSFPRAATDPQAPAVNGRPAYWDGNGLMWEYAPGAWAYLYSAGNVHGTNGNGRALDEEMADKVVFGQHRPLYSPFQFTHGLPAGWQATETDSVLTNGRLLVWQLEAGPAAKPGALTISGDTHAGTCGVQPPPQSTLTTGGILWASYYSSGPGGDQEVCAPKAIDGQYMTMYYYWRGHQQALNLVSLLRSTTFFGPDPSGWTTQPIAG
jgi:hypothetical protein